MKKTSKLLISAAALIVTAAVAAGAFFSWRASEQIALSKAAQEELQNQVAGLQTDLAGVQGNLSGMQDSLGGMQSDITEVRENVEEQLHAGEDVSQEDNVVIAGSYTIVSTLPISEAYISGDTSALDDKQKETLDMASAILEKIITPDMTDYEKEKAVYVWMTENLSSDPGLLTVIPGTQADCDNPYGVLKYHNAVCVGYATTFRLFMQMLEIPCMVCHNTELFHSWDLVQIEGSWYHTDIYSDVGSASFAHFNMTDTMFSRDQNWNTAFFPAANDSKYCYVCLNAVDETDIYNVPKALRAALDAHEGVCSLRFGSSITETDAQIVQNMLDNISSRLSEGSTYEMSMMWNWMPVDDGYVLAISITWYDGQENSDSPEIPDDAYEKIDTAVSDAFGDITY